jgi:hypothetical protein
MGIADAGAVSATALNTAPIKAVLSLCIETALRCHFSHAVPLHPAC